MHRHTDAHAHILLPLCLQEHEHATLSSDLCEVRCQLEESGRTVIQLESLVSELQLLHEEKERRMVDLQANLEVGSACVCTCVCVRACMHDYCLNSQNRP